MLKEIEYYNISDIVEFGEKQINNNLKVAPKCKLGEWIAQGDVNFIYVDKLPSNVKLIENPDRQLVQGNTVGSHHILNSLNNVNYYVLQQKDNDLQGVFLEFTGETIVTHPKHDDILFKEQTFFVSFPLEHADEVRRIQD